MELKLRPFWSCIASVFEVLWELLRSPEGDGWAIDVVAAWLHQSESSISDMGYEFWFGEYWEYPPDGMRVQDPDGCLLRGVTGNGDESAGAPRNMVLGVWCCSNRGVARGVS